MSTSGTSDIAIIGMSCRFPGADSPEAFWRNLSEGRESVRFFTDEELLAAGVPADVLAKPNYVKAAATLFDVETFDAEFFGYSPREAEFLDPQHRLFLECAWHALEDAGCDPDRFAGPIGVYAGAGLSAYLLHNLYSNMDRLSTADVYQIKMANDKDFLSTRVSYKLNLKGPSLSVQTACSTSLVAVHLACQALLNGECDMALAGGCTLVLPHIGGYLYEEGMIYSPDGHCRAFDEKAAGIVGGSGAAAVLLKPLQLALDDRDHIYAVIRGSAVNNDGRDKMSYTAPGIHGQTAVISEALAVAGVDARDVSYIEAHGTGTELGDQIEIAALTETFRTSSNDKGWCAVNSVKTYFGHLDTAAGVAGLMSAALALKHRTIPGTLHFQNPHPKLGLDSSPFYISPRTRPWEHGGEPRRAGVSSLGIGGTNAHVVLEEAPPESFSTRQQRPSQLLILSAKSEQAADASVRNLRDWLGTNPGANLADAAFTLQTGRAIYEHRRAAVAGSIVDAQSQLGESHIHRGHANISKPVAFMFSGQGAQYPEMALGLYRHESEFKATVDKCAEELIPHLGQDIRKIIFSADETKRLNQTIFTQPALFVIEYALARMLISWGIRPSAMIGHSIGEYAAACIAEVLSLNDALMLTAGRGRIMQSLPPGGMLSIALPENELRELLRPPLTLAACNAPSRCVVSGPLNAIDDFTASLSTLNIPCRRLETSHAFHSEMMEPVLDTFLQMVKKAKLSAPRIPYISNVTGEWITPTEATDPAYYARHLRQTVLFGKGLRNLLVHKNGTLALIEIGPGNALCTLAAANVARPGDHLVVNTLRHPRETQADPPHLMNALAKLWVSGVDVDWAAFSASEKSRKISLPGYAFQRQRHWIEPRTNSVLSHERSATPARATNPLDWLHIPSWKRAAPVIETKPDFQAILITSSGSALADELSARLHKKGVANTRITLDRDGNVGLVNFDGELPLVFVHLLNFESADNDALNADHFDLHANRGFLTLLNLAEQISRANENQHAKILVISRDALSVLGTEQVDPRQSLAIGAIKVIPQELGIQCSQLDFSSALGISQIADFILNETCSTEMHPIVAYRGQSRWLPCFQAAPLPTSVDSTSIRQDGTYLITGGLGGIGMELAKHIARQAKVRLILTTSRPFPSRELWRKNNTPRVFISGKIVDSLLSAERELTESSLNSDVAELDRLCVSHITEFFRNSTPAFKAGNVLALSDLKAGLRILPQFERLFDYMLQALAKAGIVELKENSITVLAANRIESSDMIRAGIRQKQAANTSAADLVQRCMESYLPALRGDIDALELLFPDSIQSRDSGIAIETAALGLIPKQIELLKTAVLSAIRSAQTQPVRILEIGGGSGQLTRALAPALAGLNVRYSFTDLGSSIVRDAEIEARKSNLTFMEFAVFDIAKDPLTQGFPAEGFDIILGLNVVHAVPDISYALSNLKRVLAPGGSLLLIESVQSPHWVNLVWGLTRGWWHFTDTDLRKLTPLLNIEQWEQVLSRQFNHVHTFPSRADSRESLDCALFAALNSVAPDKISDESMSEKDRTAIRNIREIESLGSDVSIVTANVADYDAMKNAVAREIDAGKINGVIHAAAIEGGGTIQGTAVAHAKMELAPKARGALVLNALFRRAGLDFMILCSSKASVTGGVGLSAYCAGNAFLDALAQRLSTDGTQTISIGWDRWCGIGLARGVEKRHLELTGETLSGGLSLAENLECFHRILNSRNIPHVIVSPEDLNELQRDAAVFQLRDVEHIISQPQHSTKSQLPSADLDGALEAGTERELAAIWRDVLGVSALNPESNFSALGGDSLQGIKVISRMREVFQIRPTVRWLFEEPSLRALARRVDTVRCAVATPALPINADEIEGAI